MWIQYRHKTVAISVICPLFFTGLSCSGLRLSARPVAHGPDPHRFDPHSPDPHGADPHGADPHGADPHGADPHGADPHGADHMALLRMALFRNDATNDGSGYPARLRVFSPTSEQLSGMPRFVSIFRLLSGYSGHCRISEYVLNELSIYCI